MPPPPTNCLVGPEYTNERAKNPFRVINWGRVVDGVNDFKHTARRTYAISNGFHACFDVPRRKKRVVLWVKRLRTPTRKVLEGIQSVTLN